MSLFFIQQTLGANLGGEVPCPGKCFQWFLCVLNKFVTHVFFILFCYSSLIFNFRLNHSIKKKQNDIKVLVPNRGFYFDLVFFLVLNFVEKNRDSKILGGKKTPVFLLPNLEKYPYSFYFS